MFLFFIYSSLSVDESLFNSLSLYQVMVSSFQDGDQSIGYGAGYGPSHHKGDLRGIINSLQYIKDLGFNALWMTPIFDSTDGSGGSNLQSTGYFATNYFKVDPKFGDENTLRELISKAHNLGLYVILDGVFGHHGGVKAASPNGKWPQGGSNPVSYPGSLEYFQEVAAYWIENFEIDGWRLDQMYQNGHNYLKEIRETVYSVCDKRRNQNKQWGILGYVVGEDWEGIGNINTKSYGGDGLRSAFDFPYRYTLVQTTCQEESGGYNDDRLNAYSNILKPANERGYPGNVYPNLFITNHDVWRYGNLLRSRYGWAKDNQNYWRYHKIALATLAVYTGPVTVYYGDEIGDITDCWHNSNWNECGSTTANDNCARTNGQISGFSNEQKDLHDFTAKLFNARLIHPAMWRGSYSVNKDYNHNAYFNCKYDSNTKDKILFVFSFNWSPQTVSYYVGGQKLVDLVSGETIQGNGGNYNIYLDGLTPRVFSVLETSDPTPSRSPSPSPSRSPSPSQSKSPSPSRSPSPSPSKSPSPYPSKTPKPYPSKTPKPTHTPNPENPSIIYTEEIDEDDQSEISITTTKSSRKGIVIASIVIAVIALVGIIAIFAFLYIKRNSYSDRSIMEPLSVP